MLIGEVGLESTLWVSVGTLVFLGWVLFAAPSGQRRDVLAAFGLIVAGAFSGGLAHGFIASGGLALSSLGALAGGAAGLALSALVWRWRTLEMADLVVPGGIAGLAVARLGCLFDGCDFGRPAQVGMAVIYDRDTRAWAYHVVEYELSPASPVSLAVHPFAAYLAIWGLISAAMGEVIRRRTGTAGYGALTGAALFLVGGGVIEWWREPATVPNLVEGLSVYPFIYWIGAAVVVVMGWNLTRNKPQDLR